MGNFGFWSKLLGGVAILAALAFAIYTVYNAGYDRGSQISDNIISNYEQRLDELNRKILEKDVEVRERVITNYVTRVIERERVRVVNQGVIATRVPEQHNLSQGWIHAHDQSALGKPIDPTVASDTTPSVISDREALLIIDQNYDIARANKDKLDALQQFIRDTYETPPASGSDGTTK